MDRNGTRYSKAEMIDMLNTLASNGYQLRPSKREYLNRYPDRRQPSLTTLKKLGVRFNETGNVDYKKRVVVNKPVLNEENQLRVLLSIQETPVQSTKSRSEALDMSYTSVKRILQNHKVHPYRISYHQKLIPGDKEKRVDFCSWAIEKAYQNAEFFRNVLFTDESTFRSDRTMNRHNIRYYSQQNPTWRGEIMKQGRWSVNVWGGIVNDYVIGPYFFQGNLTGNIYLNFLRESLPMLLENVVLQVRNNMWFQHDGAPPHGTRDVTLFLTERHGLRWIGNRGNPWYANREAEGPILWPPRSPDLNPLDYFLWGFVDNFVNATPCEGPNEMKDRIQEAFRAVNIDMLRSTQENFIKRMHMCLAAEGGIFEN